MEVGQDSSVHEWDFTVFAGTVPETVKVRQIKARTAISWTIRIGLMLLWFKD